MDTTELIRNSDRKMTDEELTRLAIEELNREMVKAKARVEMADKFYVQPCPLKKTNKRFLSNTIKSAVSFNRRKGHETRLNSMKKLIQEQETSRSSTNRRSPSHHRDHHRHKSNPDRNRETDKQSTGSKDVIVLD